MGYSHQCSLGDGSLLPSSYADVRSPVDDVIVQSPGFTHAVFGDNGDRIVEHFNSYSYDDHHDHVVKTVSVDMCLTGAEAFWLTMQYGRYTDSVAMLQPQIRNVEKLTADTSANGYIYGCILSAVQLTSIMHFHGRRDMAQKIWSVELCNFSFDNAFERLKVLSSSTDVWIDIDGKGTEPGLCSTRRCYWQVKCQLILDTDVPKSAAIEFLETLPDDDEFVAYSLTVDTPHDHLELLGVTMIAWVALANEKVSVLGCCPVEGVRMCVCVCARACACGGGGVCVCVCGCVWGWETANQRPLEVIS